jgi:hypothetical protein
VRHCSTQPGHPYGLYVAVATWPPRLTYANVGLGERELELGDRSLLTGTGSLPSQAQAQAQDALARRALSGSSKFTWDVFGCKEIE